MFYVVQSNDTDKLVAHLLDFYQDNTKHTSLFSPFMVIVPSMVLGDWLKKTIATKAGISTLFAAQFWGKYQWQMTQRVLQLDAQAHPHEALVVPEVAVLSASIMRWRIFGFVMEHIEQDLVAVLEDAHPLCFLLKPLLDEHGSILEHRLWQACDDVASVYVRYLTHRPHWLLAWANGQSLASQVSAMMADKARFERKFAPDTQIHEDVLPEWLQAHYLSLEKLLGYLWRQLFSQTYLYRISLERRFWQVLSGERGAKLQAAAKEMLPKKLYLFTVQQIPQVELAFLQRLSLYLDVVLLHFNPSMLFWADIVDKNWLLTQRIVKPQSVYLKDYGHGLLSRLGKESRETFAMLADMSGGQFGQDWQIDWHDDFVSPMDKANPTLLDGLKQDILMLDDSQMTAQVGLAKELLSAFSQEMLSQKSRPKVALPIDGSDSLSIHACHSLRRQLEIARLMIAKYLNEPSKKRQLADVVVLLPDVVAAKDVICSVFPEGRGIDGLYLPIKITGVPDKGVEELMTAIMGFYELLGEPSSRFYAKDVYEWLLTPALYESFGLSFEQMKRACDLLDKAGFKRGFDQQQLSLTLADDDLDYRYSFAYALDRIVLGFLSPSDHQVSTAMHPFDWCEDSFGEAVLPLAGVSLADEPMVSALTAIYQGLMDNRTKYQQVDKVDAILNAIEDEVINRYFAVFHQSQAMRAIFNAKNAMMASLRANKYYHRQFKHSQTVLVHQAKDDVRLSVKFVLSSLSQAVKSQAISAEPAQVITFARFGALRSVPFGLTVMLDMNLSAFPRQDNVMSMDLMQAGLKQRGDRYHEDDDNGAFLDALLCSKDKVLIFYNGISSDGKNLLLPASPVGELIQFLKTDALWRVADLDMEMTDDTANIIKQSLPKLLENYLVYHHDATAFDWGVFYHHDTQTLADCQDKRALIESYLHDKLVQLKRLQKRQLPPAPLWQQVRNILDNPQPNRQKVIELPTNTQLKQLADGLSTALVLASGNADEHIMAQHWLSLSNLFNIIFIKQEQAKKIIHQINHLSKTFLTGKMLSENSNQTVPLDEPLALDRLQDHQLGELLLQVLRSGVLDGQDLTRLSQKRLSKIIQSKQTHSLATKQLQALYYDSLLPVGVGRFHTPSLALAQLGGRFGDFFNVLSNIKATKHHHARFLLDAIFYVRVDKPSCYSALMTAIAEQEIALSFADVLVKIVASIPSQAQAVWLNVLPSTARATHLFGFWTHHLLWQVARQTTKADIGKGLGTSIWHFYQSSDEIAEFKNINTFALPPIDWHTARAQLMNMVVLAQIAKQVPLVMTTREALIVHKAGDEPSAAMFKKWLEKPFGQMAQQHSSWHSDWQLILGGDDAFDVLNTHLVVAAPLFAMMAKHLLPLPTDP